MSDVFLLFLHLFTVYNTNEKPGKTRAFLFNYTLKFMS